MEVEAKFQPWDWSTKEKQDKIYDTPSDHVGFLVKSANSLPEIWFCRFHLCSYCHFSVSPVTTILTKRSN